jgi:putative FmdB family regulatory protein
MPIYEYQCLKCGHVREALQKYSDPPLKACELCHGRMKKLISHSTFHLKGTGWYVTDYASKSGSSQAHSKNPEKKTGESATKKSDASEKSPEKKKTSDT